MMETSRVLTMLNAQASRQLQNEQLEAAKRTVNEAIRYYEDSKSILRISSGSSPHEDALVRCQAQVSVLLKLKIGRREAALGAQTNNDRLSESAQKIIMQSTRSLRGIMNDSRKPPAVASNVSPGDSEPAFSELTQASLQSGALTIKTKDSESVASSLSSNQSRGSVYVDPHPPSVNIPLSASASVISVASKPTALEEWYQLTQTMHSPYTIPWGASNRNINNNNCNASKPEVDQDLGHCDCFAQMKRKMQQHAVQQAQQKPRMATTITSTASSEAASVDEMIEPQTKAL